MHKNVFLHIQSVIHMLASICRFPVPQPSANQVSPSPVTNCASPEHTTEGLKRKGHKMQRGGCKWCHSATHRSWRAGILVGHCKYCLNRSSKACPMEPMTSWASPSQHSRMWQAERARDTGPLETDTGTPRPPL